MEYSLTDLCDLIMGQSPDSSSCNKNGNGIPFYQGNADFGEINPTPKNWCTEPKKTAKVNDILISVRAPIGDLNIANEDCCIGRGVAALRIKNNKCNKDYLFLFLESKSTYLQDRGTGSTFKAINKGVLEGLKVKCPEIEKQTQIVNEILNIKQAIKCKNKELLCLNEAIQSEFVEMFGENPVESGKWKVEELGKICSKISDGVHAKPEYQEDGMPFISVVNMNTGNLSFEDCKFVSFEAYEKMIKSTNPEKGDVLYTKVGATYGISALVDTDRKFCLYVSVALLKPMHDLIDSVFLAKTMMMPYVKHQADNSLKGIGVPDLHLNQIRSFKIAVPPLELQNKFAAFVQQIDKSKIVVKQQIFDLQELLDSKMQEYFGE